MIMMMMIMIMMIMMMMIMMMIVASIIYINHYFLEDIKDVVTRVNESEKPLIM
jgi:hypothetical protein